MKRVLLAVLAVGSVVGLLAWRRTGPPTATRWQYYTWFSNGKGVEVQLDSLGAEGWELVAATMSSDAPTLYFKRQNSFTGTPSSGKWSLSPPLILSCTMQRGLGPTAVVVLMRTVQTSTPSPNVLDLLADVTVIPGGSGQVALQLPFDPGTEHFSGSGAIQLNVGVSQLQSTLAASGQFTGPADLSATITWTLTGIFSIRDVGFGPLSCPEVTISTKGIHS